MLQAFQYRRLIGFGVIGLLGFIGLGARLHELHVRRHADLERKALAYLAVRRHSQPIRGEIRDRFDRPIVMVRAVKNVFIDPCKLGDRTNEMARLLAPWLGADPSLLARTKLSPRRLGADAYGTPIYDNRVCLRTGASLDDYERLCRALQDCTFGFDPARLTGRQKEQLNRLRRQSVFAEDDQERVYPREKMACQVLGLVDHDPQSGQFEARSGIERALDGNLAGTAGYCQGVRDARGFEIGSQRDAYREPVDGFNVVLTIDSALQEIATRELRAGMEEYGAQGAVAIVVRVRTGEILSLVSLPDYDLAGRAVPGGAWRNRAIQDLVEPGSTFKIVTYAAGLAEGVITWEKLVDCQHPQGIPLRSHLTDHERLQVVPFLVAFAKSSNVAASQVGLWLGADRFDYYIRQFGFCEPTGLGLSEERFSRLPPARQWSTTDLSRRAIGYGVAVTPLQLAMAMSALANDGRLMQPRLLARVVDNHGRVLSNTVPRCVRAVVSPDIAHQMLIGLKKVVTKDGTGSLAQLEDFEAAGKTGTAKVAGTVNGRPGYEHDKYRATFVGFFPADSPEVCILVMYDQPHTNQQHYYGGRSAGPTFARIGHRTAEYLRLSPQQRTSPTPRLATALPQD